MTYRRKRPREADDVIIRPLAPRLRRLLIASLLLMVSAFVGIGLLAERALYRFARHDVVSNVDKVREILRSQISTLVRNTSDFAVWSELAHNVEQPDSLWLTENLGRWYPQTFDVDVVLLLDSTGGVVYSHGGLLAFVPGQAAPDAQLAKVARERAHFDGLWKWGSYYYLLAGARIATDEANAAAQGAFITGQRITPEHMGRLEDLTQESLALCELRPDAPVRAAAARGGAMGQVYLDGYSVLRDIEGRPTALLRVTTDFPALAHIYRSFFVFLCVITGLGLLAGAIIVRQIRRWMLKPVETLRTALKRSQESHTVDWGGLLRTRDEFEQLGRAFGNVTVALHESESLSLRGIIDGATDAVLVIDADGAVQMANAAARGLLQLPSATESCLIDAVPDALKDFAHRLWEDRPRLGAKFHETSITSEDGVVEVEVNSIALGDGRLFVSLRDITQRKLAEAALRDSEERFREIAQVVPSVFWMVSADLRQVLYVSPAFSEVFGHEPVELYRQPGLWLAAVHPEDRRRVAGEWRSRHGRPFEVEYRVVRPDGTVRWLRDRGYPIQDEQGKLARITGLAEDVTARHEAVVALQESERRFRDLADLLMETVFETDEQGRITFLNRLGFESLGCTLKDLETGIHLLEFVSEEDQDRAGQNLRRVLHGEVKAHSDMYCLRRKDGSTLDVMIEAGTISEGGRCRGLRGIVIDISEQKRTEAALRESEERFRSLSDSAPVLIWMAGVDRHCFYFNRTWRVFTGRSLQCEYGKGWLEGVHPEDRGRLLDTYRSAFRARRAFTMEFRLQHADGTYHWLLDTGAPRFTPDGNFTGFIGTCTDITDRRETEEAMRSSEERFRAMFNAAQDMIFIKNRNCEYTHVNPAVERLFGLRAAQILRCTDEELFGREAVAEIRAQDTRVLAGEIIEGETRRTVGGQAVILQLTKVPMRSQQGDIVGICGIARDITQRRRVEDALSAERRLFIGGPTVVFQWRAEAGWPVAYVSPNIRQQFGYDPDDLTTSNVRYETLVHPEDLLRLKDKVEAYVQSRAACFEIEYRLRCKDGGYRWVHDFTVVDQTGSGMHHGYIMDITERRRAEESVRQSEERHRLLTEHVRDMIWSADGSFRLTYVSPAVETLVGYTPDEALTLRPEQVLTIPSLEVMERVARRIRDRQLDAVTEEELMRVREAELIRKDGSIVWVEVSMSFLRDAEGQVTEVFGITRDISERKRVERALLEHAAQYRAMAEASPLPLVVSRLADARILFANDHFCRLFRTKPEETLGKPSTMLYVDPEQRRSLVERLIREGQAEGVELRVQRCDGTRAWVSVSARLFNFEGEATMLAVVHDLSARPEWSSTVGQTASSHHLELLTREIQDALAQAGERHRRSGRETAAGED